MLENTIELEFGTVTYDDQILIATLKEGILFDIDSNRKLLMLAQEIFNGKDYGYISFRNNSYAVNPMVYRESAESENLKAIAVVTTNVMTKRNAEEVEKKFNSNTNPFEIFNDLETAKNWIKTQLNSNS